MGIKIAQKSPIKLLPNTTNNIHMGNESGSSLSDIKIPAENAIISRKKGYIILIE